MIAGVPAGHPLHCRKAGLLVVIIDHLAISAIVPAFFTPTPFTRMIHTSITPLDFDLRPEQRVETSRG